MCRSVVGLRHDRKEAVSVVVKGLGAEEFRVWEMISVRAWWGLGQRLGR